MACTASPEPDGYHRFRIAPHGLEFVSTCRYCGAEKTLRPFAAPEPWTHGRGKLRAPARPAPPEVAAP